MFQMVAKWRFLLRSPVLPRRRDLMHPRERKNNLKGLRVNGSSPRCPPKTIGLLRVLRWSSWRVARNMKRLLFMRWSRWPSRRWSGRRSKFNDKNIPKSDLYVLGGQDHPPRTAPPKKARMIPYKYQQTLISTTDSKWFEMDSVHPQYGTIERAHL